jgi:hypothetical protein
MIALGVAATWIAISAVGAKGFVVFARAAAASDLEAEPAPVTPDGRFTHDDGHGIEAWAHAPSLRP